MSKITWDSTNSLWIVNNGELIEGTTLGTNVAAMYEGSTGNFHATDFIENENTLDVWGDSIFSTGELSGKRRMKGKGAKAKWWLHLLLILNQSLKRLSSQLSIR